MSTETIDTSRLKPILPLKAPTEVPEVLHIMDQLDAELGPAGLAHVLPFNSVYRNLTSEVEIGLGIGRFSQPDTVQRTVGIFALKYLDEIGRYAQGNHDEVSKSWSKLFYDPAVVKAPEGVQFLLGMFAHIKLDLPQALNSSVVNSDYYHDYQEIVGDLIDATAHSLAPRYVPGPRCLTKRITGCAVRSIASWREKAWCDSLLLATSENEHQSHALVTHLDKSTARMSGAMLKVGGIALQALDRISTTAV
jgi:hypothetical protein